MARPAPSRGDAPALAETSFFSILLGACGAQAREAVLVDRVLPGEQFIDRERVAAAGFLQGEQATTHGRDHLGLAADDPAFRSRRRQISNRQWAAIRPYHVFVSWAKRLDRKYFHALD
jgi:hypothetical protein